MTAVIFTLNFTVFCLLCFSRIKNVHFDAHDSVDCVFLLAFIKLLLSVLSFTTFEL